MNRRSFLQMAGGAFVPLAAPAKRPNVIVILADDIGYGDIGAYGATRVRTPNLDRLAHQGVRFTDGHSASATCTPSRYAMMTGEYAWRKKGTAILPGDANLIIDTDRMNLPSMFRQAGYSTGAVGKWHLGLGKGKIDWNNEIKPGPYEVGFDYSFIIPATGDRVPCVYVENGRVVGLDPNDPIQVNYEDKIGNDPTGKERPDLLKMKLSKGHDQTIVNGISRIGYMSGGRSARWVDENMAQTLTGKAINYIERNRTKPFFLYLATHDIHVPRVPNGKFAGKSGCGLRCDAIEQLDWTVGQVLATLEKNKLDKDTMIVFASDNGPVLDDGYADGAVEKLNGHMPGGKLRGGKYSLYEGGTRSPFMAYWPGRIKPAVSDALVCQVDLLASFAAMTGREMPANAGPDSFNVLPALLGESKAGRDHLVEHARGIALREGTWKYIPPQAAPGAAQKKQAAPAELYDLSQDLSETKNLAAERPEIVKRMRAMLDRVRDGGRSRQ